MGLIVDTSLFIEAERSTGRLPSLEPGGLLHRTGEKDFGVSALTMVELAFGHAVAGARMSESAKQAIYAQVRQQFSIYPVNASVGVRAGTINAELRARGTPIGLADVLIAATALELGFGVLTHNTRHLGYVSGLEVVDAANS